MYTSPSTDPNYNPAPNYSTPYDFPQDNITWPWGDWYHTYPTYPTPKKVKKTTKTVEKFNSKGKLVSREIIVTEEEVVDIHSYPIITYATSTDAIDAIEPPVSHTQGFSDDSVSWSYDDGGSNFFVGGHSGKSCMHVN